MNSNRITMSNLATKATLVCVSLQSLAGTASGVPVLITAPKTVENGAATITPTAGGAPVPLIDAEITVNGTTLTMNGRQKIASLSLQNAALRHEIQSISAVWGLELTVFGNVDVPQNSVINMSGTGWAGGGSLGAGALGNTTCGPGGGGHGGQGGNNNCGSGGGSSSDYPNEPTFFGGGGGYYVNSIGDYGGRGGGRIRLIVSGTITLGGIIDANGQLGYEAGGGAGGSIWINASAILGTGTIRADGGAQTGASGRGGGGAGGLIKYTTCSLSPNITFSVQPGAAPANQVGSAGSIVSTVNSAPATSPPGDAISCPTGGAVFSVNGTGSEPITYLWQIESAPKGSNVWTDLSNGPVMFNGIAVGTGTGSGTKTFSFQNNPANRASFRVRCAMNNICGTVPSSPANYSVCTSDFTCDGGVDDSDFSIFVFGYNLLDCADPEMPVNCPADVNGDGFVDDQDFSIFVVAYNLLLCE